MSKHIKRRKAAFLALVVVLIAGIAGGTELGRGADLKAPFASLGYLGERVAYERGGGAGWLTSLASAFAAPTAEAASLGASDGVPALVYHGIVDDADRFNMTKATFRDQMSALKRAGWRTVTLGEFEAHLRGEVKLPPKSFLLTFDDGREDSLAGADPILRALDFRAAMFIAAESSLPREAKHQDYYLMKPHLKRMVASGRWEIGSHAMQETGGFVPIDAHGTKGNFLSSRRWLEAEGRLEDGAEYASRVAHELMNSRDSIERELGVEVDAFSYPFGDYGQQSVNDPDAVAVIGSWIQGYGLAFRQVWPDGGEPYLNHPGDDMRYLKRFETPTDWSGGQLLAFLENAADKPLPYADASGNGRGWHRTWGDVAPGTDGLRLASSASSTGASAFLDGSRAWKDYAFTASVARAKGSHVSLVGHHLDNGRYVACTFGLGRVKVQSYVDGVSTTLAEGKDETAGTGLGIRFRGPHVECLSDGNVVLSAVAEEGSGGIGLKVWDELPGNAETVFRNLSVEST